jgi:hypothetical protein
MDDSVEATYSSGGQYLKGDDLGGEDWELVVSGWEKKLMDQTDFDTGEKYKKEKFILSFAGEERKLVLNATNANTIKKAYGDRVSEWVGKAIILFESTWQDKPCIRVRVPKVVRKATEKSKYDERNPPPSDDIPF